MGVARPSETGLAANGCVRLAQSPKHLPWSAALGPFSRSPRLKKMRVWLLQSVWDREGFETGPADVFLQSGGVRSWDPALWVPTGQVGVSRSSETGLAENGCWRLAHASENLPCPEPWPSGTQPTACARKIAKLANCPRA